MRYFSKQLYFQNGCNDLLCMIHHWKEYCTVYVKTNLFCMQRGNKPSISTFHYDGCAYLFWVFDQLNEGKRSSWGANYGVVKKPTTDFLIPVQVSIEVFRHLMVFSPVNWINNITALSLTILLTKRNMLCKMLRTTGNNYSHEWMETSMETSEANWWTWQLHTHVKINLRAVKQNYSSYMVRTLLFRDRTICCMFSTKCGH